MRYLFTLFAVLLFTVPALAGPPLTHQDLWHLKRLGNPVLSPDGRWAVVSVTEPSYEEDRQVSDLWLVATDSRTPPRRLTSTPQSEESPAWSPDGGRLAFSTRRGKDKSAQIYVLPISGPGEAQRLTDQPTGAFRPVWSPDGRTVAFETWVHPGTADEEANRAAQKAFEERKDQASAYEGFPVRQWDRWRDERQRHLLIQDAEGKAPARNLLVGTDLVRQPGFAGRATVSGQALYATWTPDGSELLFLCTTHLHRSVMQEVRYDLYRVPVRGGEPRRLGHGLSSLGSPCFSPDGRYLYASATPASSFAYSQTGLVRWDWRGRQEPGEPLWLTEGFDRCLDDYAILADGTPILAAMDHGRIRLFQVARPGRVTPLDAGSRGVYSGLAASRRGPARLVANWEDSATAIETVLVDPGTGRHRDLTSFNAARSAQLERRRFEEFWFTSSQGRRIHSWMALPPAFDPERRYPLILLIHGGPHVSSLDRDHLRWSPHLLAAPGYVVLMVDYSGSLGYGEEFARGVHLDPLKSAGQELLEAADEAIRLHPFIDPSRQAAAGASYGGHLVNWLQATTQDRFACLIGHAGLVSLEGQWATSDMVFHRELNQGGPPWEKSPVWTEQSPHTYAGSFSTPILLTIGEKDFRVPLSETLAAWTYLQRNEVPGRLVVFHRANHWITNGHDAVRFWKEVHGWLERHLGAGPATVEKPEVFEGPVVGQPGGASPSP